MRKIYFFITVIILIILLSGCEESFDEFNEFPYEKNIVESGILAIYQGDIYVGDIIEYDIVDSSGNFISDADDSFNVEVFTESGDCSTPAPLVKAQNGVVSVPFYYFNEEKPHACLITLSSPTLKCGTGTVFESGPPYFPEDTVEEKLEATCNFKDLKEFKPWKAEAEWNEKGIERKKIRTGTPEGFEDEDFWRNPGEDEWNEGTGP